MATSEGDGAKQTRVKEPKWFELRRWGDSAPLFLCQGGQTTGTERG